MPREVAPEIAADSRVLVTGATGFVGRALVEELARRGWRTRAVVRSDRQAVEFADEIVRVGDIGPHTEWSEVLNGVTHVVHLAARVHQMNESGASGEAEFFKMNVLGTETLARQAALAGIRRFIFLSSIKVNGESTEGSRSESGFEEDNQPSPKDAYGRSKFEAECRIAEVQAAFGMECVVLRPALVYGPNVRANFLSLLKLVQRGLPLPLGAIENQRSMVYLGNLVDAICRCLWHPKASGKTYLISDTQPVSTPDLVRGLGKHMGKNAPMLPVPVALLRSLGAIFGKEAVVHRLTDSLVVNARRIQEELEWSPPFSADEGWGETVRWFREFQGK